MKNRRFPVVISNY